MKSTLFVAIALIIISCSRPSQEGTSADSTATANDNAIDRNSPANASSDGTLNLSAEDREQINWELFLQIHRYETLIEDNDVIAYKEEFTSNFDQFQYMLLRHNTSRAGYHESGDFYSLPYNPSEADYMAREKVNFDKDEDGIADSVDQDVEFETPAPYWSLFDGAFVNDIDTVRGNGRWTAELASGPETKLRKVTIKVEGVIHFTNVNYQLYGEVKSREDSDGISDFTVELGAPGSVARNELYLKAKVAVLTENDLAGMSKDDLGFLRNEIFARHGHTFKTAKMKLHFEPMPWYHALVDDATPLLNKFEKQNVEFIKKREG